MEKAISDADKALGISTHAKWMLWITVSEPNRNHVAVTVSTVSRRLGGRQIGRWSWDSVGIPAEVLLSLETCIIATMDEHMLTRYGLREELPFPSSTLPGSVHPVPDAPVGDRVDHVFEEDTRDL